jgi:uncharacterized protein with NRDE domain
MCVLALAWRAHPRWLLVAAGNRDEFHERPAAPLDRWAGPGAVIAGRDLRSGGTWLGVSQAGRLAVVTTRRGYGTADPVRPSRGALVADLLSGAGPYSRADSVDLSLFNPVNLIVAEAGRAQFLTNRPQPLRTTLEPGIYGLSNGALDEPWPKTLQLKSRLLAWIVDGTRTPEELLLILREEKVTDAGVAPADPSDIPAEPKDSAIFIHDPTYGTRCSTVVAVDAFGAGLILERRYDASGSATGESRFEFAWDLGAG